VFRERSLPEPIIYIHNHDFDGRGAHIGRELFGLCQADGFNNLIVDGAYRKNGTHNDNTVLTAGLKLTGEMKDSLREYNELQQLIEHCLSRFDSRDSQMTPWHSDWAGGTEGSDLRIAKEYGLDPYEITHAKTLASEVFPLERAVTPFSEYKLRLGIAIMIETAIEPKTADRVIEYIDGGGKLKVGAEVLVGLKRWETLVPKPPAVDKLLSNMQEELDAALDSGNRLISTADLPDNFTMSQRFTALGLQQKGMDFIRRQAEGTDLTPLLLAPHVLHRKPGSLPQGTRFTLLHLGKDGFENVDIDFDGFGKAPNGDIACFFKHGGEAIMSSHPDPNASGRVTEKAGNRKANKQDKFQYGTVIPGELISYSVKVGDVLVTGKPLCVLESMKMEVKISVPESLNGLVVGALACSGRTAERQGDVLTPGDLLVELRLPLTSMSMP
jgi:biotin carboxyl carrier protein